MPKLLQRGNAQKNLLRRLVVLSLQKTGSDSAIFACKPTRLLLSFTIFDVVLKCSRKTGNKFPFSLGFSYFCNITNITIFYGILRSFQEKTEYTADDSGGTISTDFSGKPPAGCGRKYDEAGKYLSPARLPEPLTGSRRNSTPVWRRPKRASSRNWRGPLPVDRPSIHRCSTIWRRCSSPPT